jgi:hypothetical protein
MTASMKILFCPRSFALRGNWESQRTLHTFANRTSQHANQNLQKSAISPTLLIIQLVNNYVG